jgi:hypothetical protein
MDTRETEDRVRTICLALPETTEKLSHGSPSFFIRDKKAFAYVMGDGHHENEYPQMWCAAAPGAQQELIAADPDRFFRPAYVGHRGWLGVRLDRDPEWSEIAEVCIDAYRAVAPKTLLAKMKW